MSPETKNAGDSRALREMLLLRFEPIAVKMMENEADVPGNAIFPKRDLHKHMALCHAFSLARREKKTVYMDKNAHWCWNPLIGLGHVDCSEGSKPFEVVCRFCLGIEDMDAAQDFFIKFPRLPMGKYQGILTAPLSGCPFEPDVVLIYANNAQLRSMLWGIKRKTGKIVGTELDAIDSCILAIVPPMQTGEYRVTLPDIGEFERAAAGEDEIILSVPKGRMDELISGLRYFEEDHHMGYTQLIRELEYEFSRPPFYNKLFSLWGLEHGRDWDRQRAEPGHPDD
jgi:uncharacterized protein (DUF169 family)